MDVIEINPGILVLLLGLAWFVGGCMGVSQERRRWRSPGMKKP